MPLVSGEFRSYDTDRSVVLFTMMDGAAEVPCAVSTSAMDELEGARNTRAGDRETQFARLRERIEGRAMRKFDNGELEGRPLGIVLRSIDFRNPPVTP